MGICWDISAFIKILKSDGETEGEAYIRLGCPHRQGIQSPAKAPRALFTRPTATGGVEWEATCPGHLLVQ